MLAQAAHHDEQDGHYLVSFTAKFRSEKFKAPSKAPSTSASWLTSRRAAPFSRQVSRIRASASFALARSKLPVGFVGQHQLGLARHRPGDRHALLLTGRELARIVVKAVRKPHPFEQMSGSRLIGARSKGHPQQHILQAGIPLKQVKGLEDVPN